MEFNTAGILFDAYQKIVYVVQRKGGDYLLVKSTRHMSNRNLNQ